jgi:glyoxylase-like metal-dependent hydrolase (beta-lactamase superfamily II)
MYASLNKLASLPDDTVLLPGHNYDTVTRATMAELKTHNQSLRMPDIEAWRKVMGHHHE